MQNLSLSIATGDALEVKDFTVDEHISSLYTGHFVVLSSNQNIDLEAAIGGESSFTLSDGGVTRKWKGICAEIHQVSTEEKGLARYSITLAPKLWLLSHRRNNRIFQYLTEVEIAQKVLKEWDIETELRLGDQYKARKFKVQYEETDFDFVNRMLEECGVSYFFDEEGKMVLADAPQTGTPRTTPLLHNQAPLASDSNFATGVMASRRVAAGQATLHDHDYRKQATYKLMHGATAGNAAEQKIETYHYDEGQFLFHQGAGSGKPSDDRGAARTDETVAPQLAAKRLAAHRFGSKEVSFEARAADLAIGMVTGIAGHVRTDLEQDKLLLTALTTTGSAGGSWSMSCKGALASDPFHPPLRTPKPTAFGVESAVVVGPSGEEIHTDEFGRIRVQFHWDREGKMDETSSCWVHVNQPWGGSGYGGSMLPRIGQEVLVQFLGGNPDRPVVVGRVYTNLQQTPYQLPDNKTQSGIKTNSTGGGGGYNELMFEDKLGSELVRMRAELDFHTRVNRDTNTSIGQDRSTDIARHETQSVGGQLLSTVGQQSISSVLSNLGSFVGADRVLGTAKTFTSQADTHALTSQTATTITVGQSTIIIGPDSIVIQSPKILLNPGADVAQTAATTGQTPQPNPNAS